MMRFGGGGDGEVYHFPVDQLINIAVGSAALYVSERMRSVLRVNVGVSAGGRDENQLHGA